MSGVFKIRLSYLQEKMRIFTEKEDLILLILPFAFIIQLLLTNLWKSLRLLHNQSGGFKWGQKVFSNEFPFENYHFYGL